ncbi:DUF1801 domain-containing protein [Paenibacillus koleovorans]|uniref:DUF1801 domain-containing protein n=1 Tax=Paenibacillus koleovorans TaxID=121608 RepID=UPI000FD921B9|nr:DUF1801 domain-containing protein [Paenibacillus koleovorans]
MPASNKSNPSTTSKRSKLTAADQVEDFMTKLVHPLKAEIEAVRSIIRTAQPHLQERIKWNAPSFAWEDDDRITFQLRGQDFFLLVLHRGAKAAPLTGPGRLVEDPTGLLNWASNDRATIRLSDMQDVEAKRDKLATVLSLWIETTSSK